eukprot:591367_1
MDPSGAVSVSSTATCFRLKCFARKCSTNSKDFSPICPTEFQNTSKKELASTFKNCFPACQLKEFAKSHSVRNLDVFATRTPRHLFTLSTWLRHAYPRVLSICFGALN